MANGSNPFVGVAVGRNMLCQTHIHYSDKYSIIDEMIV